MKVPRGLGSGDSFVFEMPETILPAAEPQNKGFLDREIVDLEDFITALSVGLLIGLSIVFGFLVGVLVVTSGKGGNIKLAMPMSQGEL